MRYRDSLYKTYVHGSSYTKREAQKYAKNQAFTKNSFILCLIETKKIIDRLALMKFNLKNLKKGGVYRDWETVF